MSQDDLIYRNECYEIQGAVFEVYREMGGGFLEAVYQECLERELAMRDIPYITQPTVELCYKGELLKQRYVPDFVCYAKIVVELKATKEIAPEHQAQILNYLKATGMRLGLLVNFGGTTKATVTRFIL